MHASIRQLSLLVSAILGVTLLALMQQGRAVADSTGVGGDYVPVTYSRLADSAGGTRYASDEQRTYQVLGVAGVPSTGVAAVVVDVAATSATATGNTNIVVWADGTDRPSIAPLHVNSSSVPRSNTIMVQPGADGKIAVYNSNGTTAINVDVQGYFTSTGSSGTPAPGGFVPTDLTRVLYTDTGIGAPAQPLAPGASITVQVAGVGEIPTGAEGVFANVHIHDISADGDIEIVPAGLNASTAKPIENYAYGAPNDSGVSLKLSSTGKITVRNGGTGSVDIAIDVEGYFSSGTSAGGGYTATTPTNLGSVTIAPGQSVDVQVGGNAGVPLTGVGGVMLNLFAVSTAGSGLGYLHASTSGQPIPDGAILSWTAGSSEADPSTSAIIKPGADGGVRLTNDSISHGSVTINVMVEGWFSEPTTGTETYAIEVDFPDGSTATVNPSTNSSVSTLSSFGTSGLGASALANGDISVTNDNSVTTTGDTAGADSMPTDMTGDDRTTGSNLVAAAPNSYDTTDPANLAQSQSYDDPESSGAAVAANTITSAGVQYTPRGYHLYGSNTPDEYTYISRWMPVILEQCDTNGDPCTKYDEVDLRIKETLRGSDIWRMTEYSKQNAKYDTPDEPSYSAEYYYWCGINIPNAKDITCDDSDSSASRSGTGPWEVAKDEWGAHDEYTTHRFGLLYTNYDKFPMIEFETWWPGYPPKGIIRFRGWDITYEGQWIMDNVSGNGN